MMELNVDVPKLFKHTKAVQPKNWTAFTFIGRKISKNAGVLFAFLCAAKNYKKGAPGGN